MKQNTKDSIAKALTLIAVSVFVILISESIFIASHKNVFAKYILNITKIAAKRNNPSLALYVFTLGKTHPFNDNNLPELFEKYMLKIPENRDLPYAAYDLAILTFNTPGSDLFEEFIDISIKWDPNFSFWWVEKANFLMTKNDYKDAGLVLDDCIKLHYPKKHCLYFKENEFKNNIVNPVGFLQDDINNFYLTKDR